MTDTPEINDRWTVHLSGPDDPRAVEYAQKHSVSYNLLGQPGVPDLQAVPGHPGSFFAANRAFDAENRQRALIDTDLHTGIGITTSFATATRGEKLRTSAQHRDAYQKDDLECKVLAGLLRLDLANCPEADAQRKGYLAVKTGLGSTSDHSY
ncbi:hypothetical protein IFR04_004019 [Cadophora malorum]|uniref:Uncharacterized protein n=1 Tax=Cadophora malorum TaxID=108018 RepID=A0A8H8BSV3_9HELO|nr:hypothetical protein IFR04_004019 [Cadophora malorum]